MFYEQILLIPKSTLISAPVVQDLPVTSGNLQRVEILFPWRCCGLAHVCILYWGRQIFPSNPDSFFTGDGETIGFDEDIDIVDPPYVFQLVGWNEDDTWPHSPIVRMSIIPQERTMASLLSRLALGPSGPVSPGGG
jgi:hypothetical protein